MAQKRMFSLKIVDTDEFLNMPISTRLLYYDLSMRADDDGFVDSPKKIMKIIGASEDDYKILCVKQYIFPFESGICVIKDWKIHNYIQKDRYQPTLYQYEMRQLDNETNGMYTFCIQNVYETKHLANKTNNLYTQSSIDKISIDKISIDKSICMQPKVARVRKSKELVVSEEFKNVWGFYPKRKGANNQITAYKQWQNRIKGGISAEDLLIATKNYQIISNENGETGTCWIFKGSRFYGANREYEQFLIINQEDIVNAKRNNRKPTAAEHVENIKEGFAKVFETARESLCADNSDVGK